MQLSLSQNHSLPGNPVFSINSGMILMTMMAMITIKDNNDNDNNMTLVKMMRDIENGERLSDELYSCLAV